MAGHFHSERALSPTRCRGGNRPRGAGPAGSGVPLGFGNRIGEHGGGAGLGARAGSCQHLLQGDGHRRRAGRGGENSDRLEIGHAPLPGFPPRGQRHRYLSGRELRAGRDSSGRCRGRCSPGIRIGCLCRVWATYQDIGQARAEASTQVTAELLFGRGMTVNHPNVLAWCYPKTPAAEGSSDAATRRTAR